MSSTMYKVFTIIIFMMGLSGLFSQSRENSDLISPIIPNESFLAFYEYTDISNKPLKTPEIWEIVSSVPDNKRIVKKGKIVSKLVLSSAILTFGSMAAYGALTVGDYNNPTIMNYSIPITFTVSFLAGCILDDYEDKLLEKSIYNYTNNIK